MNNSTVQSLSDTISSISDLLSVMNVESNVVYVVCFLLALVFVGRQVKASSCTYPGGRLRLVFRRLQGVTEVEENEENPTPP